MKNGRVIDRCIELSKEYSLSFTNTKNKFIQRIPSSQSKYYVSKVQWYLHVPPAVRFNKTTIWAPCIFTGFEWFS